MVTINGQTFTRGQHPHWPVGSLQQVVPEAQLVLSSHFTSVALGASVVASTLVNQGMTTEPLEQTPCGASQVRDSGQQWTPSLQQTACTSRKRKQTQANGYIKQEQEAQRGPSCRGWAQCDWRWAAGSSPICGSPPWSSRWCLGGSSFGGRTRSCQDEPGGKRAPATRLGLPGAPGASAARGGWPRRDGRTSARPRCTGSPLDSSARDRCSKRPEKMENDDDGHYDLSRSGCLHWDGP